MGQRSEGNGVSAFGAYLTAAIAKAGFASPTAFARATKHDPSVVLRWINGQSMPRSRTLAAVAPVLKVRPADLIAAAYPDVTDGDELPPEPSDDPPAGSDAESEPVDLGAELMTRIGVHANLFVNRLDLTDLIHDSGLGPEDRFDLIKQARLAQREFDRRLLEQIGEEIRRRGGTTETA